MHKKEKRWTNISTKKILMIVVGIIATFYIFDAILSFIYYDTNIFKTAVNVTGTIENGWLAGAVVGCDYLETDNGTIYYLDSMSYRARKSRKIESFKNCTGGVAICYHPGERVNIVGFLTRQKIEILTKHLTNRKRVKAQIIEVKEASLVTKF